MTPEAETDEIKNPSKSAEWLDLISDAETYFSQYQDSADAIDRTYSNLSDLRTGLRDRDFALFWSNIQVMGPAVYARPPQPVVTPKFKDRRPLYRIASEMLERVVSVAFDQSDINRVMIHARDDLIINARGVAWVKYETDDGQRICIEHIDRRDFLHDPARKWCDVGWVARRGWMSYSEMKERFTAKISDAVSYSVSDKDNRFGPDDNRKKCGVWEMWHKAENKVVWVTEGHDDVLDEGAPHLKLEGFFPCPQPAYATVQRRTLIPVSDVIYYKGQIEQINDLTARIHAIGNGLQLKGFYQGGGDIGDAIETAMKAEDDGRVLIPVSSLAAFGSGGDPVVWMPIDMVATTLTALVELRRQLIEDVYQIIGLSDIMRGATQAEETLGAQQLKQQNGSARVKDKQNELVRLARDTVRIAAEIIAENFSRKTMTDMAQMDVPTRAEIAEQVKELEAQNRAINRQVRDAQANPKLQQADPKAVEQAMSAAQEQLQALQQQASELDEKPTIEDVLDFLKDQKLRPFVLDIETDSTIYPDEMQEKASRQEFLSVFSGAMAGVAQLAALGPQALGLAGGVLKFTLAPYRVGRELEGLIDDFVDAAPQIAQQMAAAGAEGGDQEAMAQLAQAELQKAQAQTMKVEADAQSKMQEIQLKAAEAQARAQADQQRFGLEVEDTKGEIAKTQADIQKIMAEIQLEQQKLGLEAHREQREDVKLAMDAQGQAQDRQMAERDQAMAVQGQQTDTAFRAQEGQRADKGEQRADRQQGFAERSSDRQMTLAEKQAASEGAK